MNKIKVGAKIKVIQEDLDHPFMLGEKLTVTEILDYGCVWARNSNKELGCLIPKEFIVIKGGK